MLIYLQYGVTLINKEFFGRKLFGINQLFLPLYFTTFINVIFFSPRVSLFIINIWPGLVVKDWPHEYSVDFHGYFDFRSFVSFQMIISSISSTSRCILVLVVTGLERITFLKNDQLNQLLDNWYSKENLSNLKKA